MRMWCSLATNACSKLFLQVIWMKWNVIRFRFLTSFFTQLLKKKTKTTNAITVESQTNLGRHWWNIDKWSIRDKTSFATIVIKSFCQITIWKSIRNPFISWLSIPVTFVVTSSLVKQTFKPTRRNVTTNKQFNSVKNKINCQILGRRVQ